jgi:hypothetical protein
MNDFLDAIVRKPTRSSRTWLISQSGYASNAKSFAPFSDGRLCKPKALGNLRITLPSTALQDNAGALSKLPRDRASASKPFKRGAFVVAEYEWLQRTTSCHV